MVNHNCGEVYLYVADTPNVLRSCLLEQAMAKFSNLMSSRVSKTQLHIDVFVIVVVE